MSPEERQEIIDDFRLKYWYNNGISKINTCQKINQINQVNLEQKLGLKEMMNPVKLIALIVKLNLKL